MEKGLCIQFKEFIKSIQSCFIKQHEELQKYSELCRLTNEIAYLSSGKVARALDHMIKEIAYSSIRPNYEVRNKYLHEVIEDFLSGMDATDVLLKYEYILYKYKGWL